MIAFTAPPPTGADWGITGFILAVAVIGWAWIILHMLLAPIIPHLRKKKN